MLLALCTGEIKFMGKTSKYVQYLAGVFLFTLGYGICNFIAYIIITAINADSVHPVLQTYVVPYFVAVMAGFLGVVGGLAIVSWLLPNIQKRPVVWVFTGLMVIIWFAVIWSLIIGNEPDPRTPAMALQAIAAVVAAFKLTAAGRRDSI